jgi:hypothetical protein
MNVHGEIMRLFQAELVAPKATQPMSTAQVAVRSMVKSDLTSLVEGMIAAGCKIYTRYVYSRTSRTTLATVILEHPQRQPCVRSRSERISALSTWEYLRLRKSRCTWRFVCRQQKKKVRQRGNCGLRLHIFFRPPAPSIYLSFW